MKKFTIALLLFLSFNLAIGENQEAKINKEPVIEILRFFKDWNGGGTIHRIDLSIKFKNISPKTIKYVYFTVIPYNSINDEITDEVVQDGALGIERCTERTQLKVVGFIKPGKTKSVEFENVWASSEFHHYRIAEECEIVWEDGTLGTYKLKYSDHALYKK